MSWAHSPCKKLLLLLATCRLPPEQQLPENPRHSILSGKNIIRFAKVEREVSIPTNGRVDIVVTIELAQEQNGIQRLQIVLENKVNAAKTDRQTIHYYQHLSTKAEYEIYPIFVYLSPRYEQPC